MKRTNCVDGNKYLSMLRSIEGKICVFYSHTHNGEVVKNLTDNNYSARNWINQVSKVHELCVLSVSKECIVCGNSIHPFDLCSLFCSY